MGGELLVEDLLVIFWVVSAIGLSIIVLNKVIKDHRDSREK